MADVELLFHPTLDVEGTAYRVLRYHVEEALSAVPTVRVDAMLFDQETPPPSDLVGKAATFALERVDGSQKREWAGILRTAGRVTEEDGVRIVRVKLVPKLWRLEKRRDCRIFQEKDAKEIVSEVLEGAGVPAANQHWDLEGTPPKRVYTVQYRETDLDFVLRLLGEEGIWFSVVTKDGKDVVNLTDHGTGLGDVEGTTTLGYRQAMGWQQGAEVVSEARAVHKVRSDKVTLRDYNPEKPKLKLEETVEGTDEGAHPLEVYAYPGRFDAPDVGKRWAQALLDGIQCRRDRIHGSASAIHLVPGYRFTLEDHPYAPLNQEYLIIGAELRGTTPRLGARAGQEAAFTCTFEGVPTKTAVWRPERRRREALVPGLQTAMTVGPSGEEIHTNAGGEVKVQFFWDRLGKNDDKSSRWMRTSQLPTGGSMLLPRMKWEVSVRHLEGDADRPMVFGRLYNGTTPPPYKLPDHKGRSSLQTATTPGGGSSNEFRMSDGKGSEQMMFNASKDMSLDVKNNATESVGNDSAHEIGSNHKKSVTNSSTTTIGGNQKLTVKGAQKVTVETLKTDDIGGDHSLTIGGNRDMKVGGDHKRDVGGDSKFDIGGRYIDLVVGNLTDQCDGDMTHKVGIAYVQATAADITETVGKNMTENTTAAKIIVTNKGRGVDIGGTLMQKVAGAIVNIAKGDKEVSGKTYTEIAAGAQLVKATNVTFEAETMLAIVMGASTVVMLPALTLIGGISLKLDGDLSDKAILNIDN